MRNLQTTLTLAGGLCFLLLVGTTFCCGGEPGAESKRHELSLDGVWEIAEGTLDQVPQRFDRKVPVPGLVSLAKPPFVEPGPAVKDRRQVEQKDARRDAFWYRRTFQFEDAPPEVATLKVAKAMFGTRVFLNGRLIGDHQPCFTPGYFDVRQALKRGENELMIRVGADRAAVTSAVPSGFDFEKERYIPGIFDSVTLVLSGTPHFVEVQAAPDITNRSARVQAVLRNDGEAIQARITFKIREAKSGRLAGRLTDVLASIDKGAERTLDVVIPIENCRLWSPETPFLYTLEVDSGSDTFVTRFGMRDFRFDPASGRAMLNGKPYFMRGSNITLYRFFEDPDCGDLPWQESWVRRLHRRIKDMHWNCLRYCIGFPPEAWYRIADEEGILIQDEFPIWFGGKDREKWPKELQSPQLATEYAEWMRERWNHPCVVIWDASNETASDQTGPAIRQVRGLDLSNRPWDNSYVPPQEPEDVFESHPYHFNNPHFKLSQLAEVEPVPQGNPVRNSGRNAVIINEYGWLWLNRDGTPTTLTSNLFQNLLGPQSTTEERRQLYARYLAAETEFWRCHRKAAAVMHFTALGYSRSDGQTSDHWQDVRKLEWEPQFYRYVRDAFEPVALMIGFWKERMIGGVEQPVPVHLINDLPEPWSGPITLRLKHNGRVLEQATKPCRLEACSQAEVQFRMRFPGQPGAYTLEAELRGAGRRTVQSLRTVRILASEAVGLTFEKPVKASSVLKPQFEARRAVDADPNSYWSSAFSDPAWLEVDLEEPRMLSNVRIDWEQAHAKAFAVQLSTDGKTWQDAFRTEAGQGGVNNIRFAPAPARWIRIYGTSRATKFGYAIRELQAFEESGKPPAK